MQREEGNNIEYAHERRQLGSGFRTIGAMKVYWTSYAPQLRLLAV
jgi:hypothetical protein